MRGKKKKIKSRSVGAISRTSIRPGFLVYSLLHHKSLHFGALCRLPRFALACTKIMCVPHTTRPEWMISKFPPSRYGRRQALTTIKSLEAATISHDTADIAIVV